MSSLWTFLEGKKTYILSAISVLYIAGQWWAGSMDDQSALLAIAGALGFSTVHHAIVRS